MQRRRTQAAKQNSREPEQSGEDQSESPASSAKPAAAKSFARPSAVAQQIQKQRLQQVSCLNYYEHIVVQGSTQSNHATCCFEYLSDSKRRLCLAVKIVCFN